MKILFILASVMFVLFLAAPNKVEAQRGKTSNKKNRSAIIHPPAKCAVVVRNDLVPNRGVVVVGCDSFGIHEGFRDMQGKAVLWPSNGGVIVFDVDMNVLLKYEACTGCGGFFDRFLGVKKVKGRNALMVQLINGPRMETGVTSAPIVPLYFDGRRLRFIDVEAQ